MKRIVAILVVLTIVFQSFGKLYVFVDYMFYKNYYADVLCINKDKPEMHCNGQCAFMQKIKSQEKSETPISNVVYKLFETVLFTQFSTITSLDIPTHFLSSFYPELVTKLEDGVTQQLDRPPHFSLI